MRIGALAEATGVSRDTLRFYEKQGLIQADRWPNGYRDYPEGMIEMVRLIRQAQALGFGLSEIGALLRGLDGGFSAGEVEAVLREKLAEIDGRLQALQELRTVVAARLEAACPLTAPQAGVRIAQ